MRETYHRTGDEALTRSANVLLSIVGLVVFAIIILPIVAVFMKGLMPGPIFYGQMRIGLGGRSFTIYKLRTMGVDAEKNGPKWASLSDLRITPFGRLLRRSRIDELPQLWNVILDDMNLVGPRPERPKFTQNLEALIPAYHLRHAVRPGITGLAQIRLGYGASITDAKQKLRYDLRYVRSRSVSLDMLILLKTVPVVVLLRGV